MNQNNQKLAKKSEIREWDDLTLPLLSIITVVLNGETTLEKTILSVINQNYPNTEYIIIDGASTDGTIEIIKKYQDKINHWISEPDKGIYDAMNKGIRLAKGEIIGIINSDDYYAPQIFRRIIDCYLKNRSKCIAGNLDVLNDENRIINNIKFSREYKRRIISGGPASHPTIFVPKKIYQTVGLFDNQYKIAADFEWQVRGIIRHNVEYAFIDETIAVMRVGGISSGLMNRRRVNKEVFRIRKKYNFGWAYLLGFRDLIVYFLKIMLHNIKIIEAENS